MQINLTGHHIEITPPLREYVQNKFAKLEKHYGQINNAYAVLTVERLSHIAEAKLHITGGDIHASAEQSDMYAAIDVLLDKLDRQLIKHKEKTVNKH